MFLFKFIAEVKTMDNRIVAGVDISKNFSDMCILAPDNSVLKELHFEHNEIGLNKAEQVLCGLENQFNSKPVVIMESTSHYHRLLYYFLRERGYDLIVVNPLQSNAIKNISIRKIKSDKIDAYRIALLYRLQDFKATNVPVDTLFDLRNLTRQHSDMIKTRSMYVNQLIAVMDQAFPSFRKVFKDMTACSVLALLEKWQTPQNLLLANRGDVYETILKASRSGKIYSENKVNHLYCAAENDCKINIQSYSNSILIKSIVSVIKTINENLELIKKEVQKIIISDDIVAGNIALLETIPGISWFGAAVILCEIGDFTKFHKPAQLVAYCGIDPSQRQSGMYKGTKNKISKRGCRYIRRLLNMSAITAVSKNSTGSYNNPILAEYYRGKCLSKPKKVVLCSIMNKLIHIIFAVLRDQKPFEFRKPEDHAAMLKRKQIA